MITNESRLEVHAEGNLSPRNFKQAVKMGKVQFYRVRRNGTTRHIPYLVPGSDLREIAEKVEALRDKDVSIATIASQMGVSEPTVRRYIERLRFAREIEKARGVDVQTLVQKAKQ